MLALMKKYNDLKTDKPATAFYTNDFRALASRRLTPIREVPEAGSGSGRMLRYADAQRLATIASRCATRPSEVAAALMSASIDFAR